MVSSIECGVHDKSKEERAKTLFDIMEGVVQVKLAKTKGEFRYCIYIFNFIDVNEINSL